MEKRIETLETLWESVMEYQYMLYMFVLELNGTTPMTKEIKQLLSNLIEGYYGFIQTWNGYMDSIDYPRSILNPEICALLGTQSMLWR